jgi:putative modified peptide
MARTVDPTRQISLFADPNIAQNTTALSSKLISDHTFREAFIADPNSALRQIGIPLQHPVALTERDKLVLRLIGDQSVETLYKSGDIARLREYLTANYGGLVVAGVNKADVAADFDVLIEAEVVAIGVVAVVAAAVASVIAQPGLEAQVESSAVANARIAALEARLQLVEGQLAAATRGRTTPQP